MRKRIYDLACPIANALDVVGDRWTLLILRDLLLGRRRYREFQDSLPGIPPNLLTERLRLLEMEGVVERRIYSDSPLRAEYAVTAKGHELAAVMASLARWGERHYPSDDGAGYRLRHAGCNGVVASDGVCGECGRTVAAADAELARLAIDQRSADVAEPGSAASS
jgi:DNA-binding HxlR family transcriptional regulator